MKRSIMALAGSMALLAGLSLSAAPTGGPDLPSPGPEEAPKPEPSAWTLTFPLGFHEPSTIDTLQYNYQRQTIPSMATDAFATTGNLGAEGIDLIYFDRPRQTQFFFADALDAWIPSFRKQKFYNVYTPMTLASYNYGGGKENHQDRLRGTFAGNVNSRIGIGAFVDYIHSKGCYADQSAKDFSFGFSGYYTGTRYEMQAFYQQYNFLNKENGGITDDTYIHDPASLQGGVSKIEEQSIPVRLSDAFNRVTGSHLFMTHAYKLGFWQEEEREEGKEVDDETDGGIGNTEENDSTVRRTFVPVAKIIYSFDYFHQRHVFRDFSSTDISSFWRHRYLDPDYTGDRTTLNTFTNTLGLSMVEGFRKWVKFSLAAYASFEHRVFRLPTGHEPERAPAEGAVTDPLPAGVTPIPRHDQNILWIGGRLEKGKGNILRYAADARFGLTDDFAGDLEVNGRIQTNVPLFRDTVTVKASGFFRNSEPSWLLNHYVSNNFAWDNSFGKTRTFRVDGEIRIPWTRTTLGAGFENTQNMVYFGRDCLPAQFGGSVQVFSARLKQELSVGILHWNNTVTFQTTSNQNVLPLPKLAVYSNLFIQARLFRVLNIQLGVDCDYYTKYCGLGYQPATMSFHVQNSKDIGNYPFCNAYLNCKLYKCRFYVMVTHVNQGWFGTDYFSLPGYPMNPRRFMLGLSVDFAD